MHCSSCASMIDLELEDLPGVKKSSTSFAKSEVDVEFDPQKISLDQILSKLSSLGYPAA